MHIFSMLQPSWETTTNKRENLSVKTMELNSIFLKAFQKKYKPTRNNSHHKFMSVNFYEAILCRSFTSLGYAFHRAIISFVWRGERRRGEECDSFNLRSTVKCEGIENRRKVQNVIFFRIMIRERELWVEIPQSDLMVVDITSSFDNSSLTRSFFAFQILQLTIDGFNKRLFPFVSSTTQCTM